MGRMAGSALSFLSPSPSRQLALGPGFSSLQGVGLQITTESSHTLGQGKQWVREICASVDMEVARVHFVEETNLTLTRCVDRL